MSLNEISPGVFVVSQSSEDVDPAGRLEREGEGKYGDRNYLFTTSDRIAAGDVRGNLYSKLAISDSCQALAAPSKDLCAWMQGADSGSTTVSAEVTDFIAEVGFRHYGMDKPIAGGGNFLQKVNGAIGGAVHRMMGGRSGHGGQSGGGKMTDLFVEALDKLAPLDKPVGEPSTAPLIVVDISDPSKVTAQSKAILDSAVDASGATVVDYVVAKVEQSGKTISKNDIYGKVNEALDNYYTEGLTQLVTAVQLKVGDKNKLWKDNLEAIAEVKNELIKNVLSYEEGLGNEIAATVAARTQSAVTNAVAPKFDNQHTTLSQEHAGDLFKNVIQRWSSLHVDTKDFYDTFIGVEENTTKRGWQPVHSSQYTKKFGGVYEVESIRINLKKGNSATRFEESIPLIPPMFTRLSYTDASGTVKTVALDPLENGAGNPALREIYAVASKGGKTVPEPNSKYPKSIKGTINLPGLASYTGTHFSYKMDKLVKDMLYDLANATRISKKPGDVDDSLFGDSSSVIDMIDGHTWSRSSPGVYQKVDRSGRTTSYGRNDPATVSMLKASHSCYSSGYNGKECDTYIHKALLEGDKLVVDKKLSELLLTGDFFVNAQKDINNMHPLIALRTLQRFGFREHDVYDNQAGRSIRKIETKDHWLTSDALGKKFPEKDELDAIKKSGKLLDYLDTVARYVNANPGILNDGHRGASDEGSGFLASSDYVNSLGIKQRKEARQGGQKVYRRLGAHLKTVGPSTSPFTMTSTGLIGQFKGTPARTPDLILSTPVVVGQHGGSGAILRGFNEGSDVSSGADYITEVVRSSLNDLRGTGRYLKADDVQRVENALNRLSKDEEKLLRLVHMIEEYNRLLVAQKDYKTEGVSISKVNDLLEKHARVSSRHYNDQQALQVLLEAVEEQGGNSGNYGDLKIAPRD